jgi:hypothetical protein
MERLQFFPMGYRTKLLNWRNKGVGFRRASGRPAAAPPTSMMNAPRLIPPPRRRQRRGLGL